MTSQVALHEIADGSTLALSGELDASTSATLRDRLLPRIPDGAKIRLDLSGLLYISSAGLRTLLLLYRHAQSRGTQIVLAGMRDDIRFVMSATGFLSLFDTSDDLR